MPSNTFDLTGLDALRTLILENTLPLISPTTNAHLTLRLTTLLPDPSRDAIVIKYKAQVILSGHGSKARAILEGGLAPGVRGAMEMLFVASLGAGKVLEERGELRVGGTGGEVKELRCGGRVDVGALSGEGEVQELDGGGRAEMGGS